jgi:glycosyltransferase involved in cell wall biosynthesis
VSGAEARSSAAQEGVRTRRGAGRGRVCFYSEYAYPLIARGVVPFAGGAEAMVVRLARGLAVRDYEVSLVTCDYGQPARELIDGVTVLRAFRPGRGLPVLRFFHPRLTLAISALMRADADVYYVCGSGMSAGLTCDVAKLLRAGFVLAMMTDYDVMAAPPPNVGVTNRRWYLRALARANRVLAQTEFQQTELRRNFGVESAVLPNLVEIPAWRADPGQEGVVFWQATYKAIKRPEWFLRLARDLPQVRFAMAGIVPESGSPEWEAAVAASRELPNLEVHGFLSDDELVAMRRRSALVVHTSPVEGFSNVLLEAWACGLPTVSGVNPDDLVTREGLGAYAPDYDALLAAVRRLMADPGARASAGERARRYAESRHGAEAVFGILTPALDGVIATARRRKGRR